jgi:type II secretory pathway pseudopilin PulG
MRRVLALIGFMAALVASGEAMAQAKAASYDALSNTNRRIVSAIYEAQLGSRRDMAGHPLLSKDEITAMRRAKSWEEVHQRLAARGYVASQSLADAVRSYNRDVPVTTSRLIIISTGSGNQVVINRYRPPSAARPPTQANVIPAPASVRPTVTVVELPVTTAAGPADAPSIDTQGGIIAAGATADIAGPSGASGP